MRLVYSEDIYLTDEEPRTLLLGCSPLEHTLILFSDETWVCTSGFSANKPEYVSGKELKVHTSRAVDLGDRDQNFR